MKRGSRLAIVAMLLLACFSHPISAKELAGDKALPGKPILARVTAVSLFEIDLTWRDKSSNEDGFQIERSTDKINFRQIAQVLPGTTVYRDKNLFPGTRYYYRIRAFNGSGSSGYSTGSGRTPSPARPLTMVTWGNHNAIGTNAPDVVSVAEGSDAALVLHKNGTVTAANDLFQQAQPPTNLTDVAAIAAGSHIFLALKTDGTVVQWGNYYTVLPKPMPTNLTGVVAIAGGFEHFIALKGDGTVVGWGNDFSSQATPPAGLSGVVAIAAGDSHSLALKSDGTVVEWGQHYAFPSPTNLPPAVAIAVGNNHSFVIDSNGTVTAWGDDFPGNDIPSSNFTGVVSIAAGFQHTEGLTKDGNIVSWDDLSPLYNRYAPPDFGGGAVSIATLGDERVVLSLSPASPSQLQAKVLTARRIVLSWQNNSTGETGFQIERATNGFPLVWTRIASVNRGVTNFTDNGIAPSVTYLYRVRAINHLGNSPYSDQIAVVTEPLAVPQLDTPALGSNDVIVSWSDTVSSGSFDFPSPYSGIDGFKIERAQDVNGVPGSWTEIGSAPAVANVPISGLIFQQIFSFADASIAPNTMYWYRVRAFNVLGISDYSDPVSFDVAAPATPHFSMEVLADQARLYWSPYQPLTQGVKIEHAPDVNSSPGTWTEITELGPIDDFYADSNLTVNTTWWYRMRAFNWVGDSPYTDPQNVTILPPGAPELGGISLASSNAVHLIWYDGVLGAEGYILERAIDVNGQPGDWTQINVSHFGEDNSNTFDDTNVLVSATYWYRVKSFNVLGESHYSAPASITIAPPPAPSLSVSAFRNQIDLGWSFDGSGTVGFKIERAPDLAGNPGQWTQIALLPTNNPIPYNPTSYTDRDLSPDKTYWYRIRAFNWAGDSPYSDAFSASIVPPAAPSDITAFVGDTNQVILAWSGFSEDDGFYIESAPDSSGAPGPWTQIATFPVEIHSLQPDSYIDTNVVANTTNWYRVRAYSVTGVSDYSAATNIAIIPPGIPILRVDVQANRAVLSWDDETIFDEATASYVIERAPDFNGNPGAWTQIAAPAKGVYYFVDPSGTAGLTAWYRIHAVTWVGMSAFCDPLSATFAPPSQPLSLYYNLGTTNQLKLYWYDSLFDEDGFEIERAPDANGLPGAWTQIGNIFATNTGYAEFVDTNATAYTTNWYRVRAFTSGDISGYNTPVQAAIVPPQPPFLYGGPSDTQIFLYWSSADYYSAGIAGFKIERAPDVNGSPGTWLALTNVTDMAYTDSNVSGTNVYWYRVRAYNWVGDSGYSNLFSAKLVPEIQVPIFIVPRPAHLLSVTLTNGGAFIEWSISGGGTNVVQAANDFAGSYTDISPPLNIESTETVITNYFDAGALTNASRFYRVRTSR
jgi:hypothetical protein